jgi:hypothetical protein
MWDRHSLQNAILGQPVFGDPLQIAFGATHIDRRQLEWHARELEGYALAGKNENRKTNRPNVATSKPIRFSFFGFR